jgi:two-component system, LytTR family, response regulator
MIKAVVLSGDGNIIEKVKNLIQSFCPVIELDGSSGDLKTGISQINQYQPDLVFIDTFLTDGSGFELLNHFTSPDFKIIFISEYNEYATKAIDYGAIGYLLKPVNDQKFIAAAQRATEKINQEEKLQISLLENNLKNIQQQEKIMLRTSDQMHLVGYDELVSVEADGNYSTFYISDGRKVIVSKPLKKFEEKLLENGFFRIHKSHMINIKKLSYFDKADGGFVIMADQSRIPVASRKRDAVIELLDTLS